MTQLLDMPDIRDDEQSYHAMMDDLCPESKPAGTESTTLPKRYPARWMQIWKAMITWSHTESVPEFAAELKQPETGRDRLCQIDPYYYATIICGYRLPQKDSWNCKITEGVQVTENI